MPTVAQYRSDLAELVRLAHVDLSVLWRKVNDAVVARELLADILPELVAVYGTAAGTLSADWYDDLREELEVAGRFSALVADLPPRTQTDAVARWAVTPLFSSDPDFAGAYEHASGSVQRLIWNVGRDTIRGSSIEDPSATGWQRDADGGCEFCQMLASRGAVYSESSVDFGAHNHCNCTAVPAFDGKPRPVEPYTPSPREVTAADRARVRDWMSDNGY